MAVGVTVAVIIDQGDLARFVANDPQVDASYRGLAEDVADRATALAPRKTGRLASSIVVERARDPGGRFAPGYAVGPTVGYGGYVSDGTAAHRIDGNPLLRFYWPKVGSWVAFRHVRHPGTDPNTYLEDALQSVF